MVEDALIVNFEENQISDDAIRNVPALGAEYSFDVLVNSKLDLLSALIAIDLDPEIVLYQSELGHDDDVPNPALVAVFPELAFDTVREHARPNNIAHWWF